MPVRDAMQGAVAMTATAAEATATATGVDTAAAVRSPLLLN
jgi:hypothetical protein